MILQRDPERFRYLSFEPKAILPEGYRAPLNYKTSKQLIQERLDKSQDISQV